jgi:tripeptidyl-peptidase-1
LSHDEVNALVKPKDEALESVHEWLLSNGIGEFDYSPSKDWINIKISVEKAEELLETEYSVYVHDDGTEHARTTKWSLPRHLHAHIDTIQPTTSFMRTKTNNAEFKQLRKRDGPWPPADYKPPTDPALARACSINGTTPECFNTLYKTKGYKQKAAGKNQIGFNNFLKEVPIRPDAALFLKKYNPSAVKGAYEFKFISIDGGPQHDNGSTPAELAAKTGQEANLDAQTIIGMTYPMPVTAYTTGGEPPYIPDEAAGDPPGNEPYLAWVTYALGQKNPPQVISTSYGDDEQTVPYEYAKRVCSSFAQLGARGVTLLFSSGDHGAGNAAGNNAAACISNDGKNTTKFLPSFPASCPYVTTVGATQGFQPETAAFRPADSLGPDGKLHSYYASGSGFSDYFARPSYQDKALKSYFKKLGGLRKFFFPFLVNAAPIDSSRLTDITDKGLYNVSGRGYPDVSAQGLYFQFFYNSTDAVISGTSASSPLMASVLALVNDALIAAGKPTLGFMNPWLYKKGYKGFTDILSGGNGGCDTTGFPVTKGWDAVTGFGTPVFPEIIKLVGAECD